MTLYSKISEFGQFFNSIRKHEDFMVIDLKLPLSWQDDKILKSRGGKIQMKIGNSNEKYKLVSFFNIFSEEGCDTLLTEIKAVIKWNKDVEEKNELLNLKTLELKKMFAENNVDALRKLNFEFHKNDTIELNGERDTETIPVGTIEGPTGNPTT